MKYFNAGPGRKYQTCTCAEERENSKVTLNKYKQTQNDLKIFLNPAIKIQKENKKSQSLKTD